jgi:hypothetical protein
VTNSSRERDHVNPPSACPSEAASRLGRSSAGRIDIVDEDDSRRWGAARDEGSPDIATTLREPELALRLPGLRSREQRQRWDLPDPAQAIRKGGCGVMAAAEAAIRVSWDEREGVGARPHKSVGEEGRGDGDQPAERTLLPRGDEQARLQLVPDCGSGRREGDPAPSALAAPPYRPGGRRAAALADRSADARQGL